MCFLIGFHRCHWCNKLGLLWSHLKSTLYSSTIIVVRTSSVSECLIVVVISKSVGVSMQ